MLKSSLRDHSDAYILVKGTKLQHKQGIIQIIGIKKQYFKNCTPFTDYISEINTQIDNAKDIDAVMAMHNLKEYSNNYSKISGCSWQYHTDEPALTSAGAITNFHAANNSALFKFKQKIAYKTDAADGRKDAEIMVPLKYLSNFWKIFEMPLINCENNLILGWSDKCVLSNDTKETTFAITNTKLYVPVVTLSTQENYCNN